MSAALVLPSTYYIKEENFSNLGQICCTRYACKVPKYYDQDCRYIYFDSPPQFIKDYLEFFTLS